MQPSPIAETSSPLFPSSRFFMLKISQESGIQETNFLLLNFYFLLRPCSLRFQRSHVDREPILHIGFKQSLVSFVHFLNWDHFDIGGDVVCAAKIEHLLRLGDSPNRGPGETASPHDQAERGHIERLCGSADQRQIAIDAE